jgi:hypothetical protein
MQSFLVIAHIFFAAGFESLVIHFNVFLCIVLRILCILVFDNIPQFICGVYEFFICDLLLLDKMINIFQTLGCVLKFLKLHKTEAKQIPGFNN